MPSNPRGVVPLNWPELVEEATRRRKAEKMTQRQHAALAGVSIPTIVAFDRGERTLSLAKAFDILQVVGLIEASSMEGVQETFVREAFNRWRELTVPLPENSPGRLPHGWYRIDYALEGDLKSMGLRQFRDVLEASTVRHTGWPLFLFFKRPELAPYEIDEALECWLRPEDAGASRSWGDAVHCDFWRVAPTGRALTIRGYTEDGQETFPPHTILDTTLPTWRIGEAFLHAEKLAGFLAVDAAKINVRMRVLYTGLSGRVLRSWANPLADLFVEGRGARSDEAMLETVVPVSEINAGLAKHLQPLISSLFERFGVSGLTTDKIESELIRMRSKYLSPI